MPTRSGAQKGPGVLAARFTQAARRFIQTETSGSTFLFVAAALALLWANSPFADTYTQAWQTSISTPLGEADARHLINDGLMTLFFLVVGLEIQRELTVGELSDRRTAGLPVVAAIGGMVVPALIYLTLNAGQVGARGWGIPMATDIAFAVGVLALLGPRVPHVLKIFLLSLAIADDIGAIAVIAVFYTANISLSWLAAAAALVVALYVLRRKRIRALLPYVFLGAALWVAVLNSGVHATIAGVMIGLLTPGDPRPGTPRDDATMDSPAERLENRLHPWTSNVVIPLFALANAGLRLDATAFGHAVSSRIAWGVFFGLVLGKVLGITLFSAAGAIFGRLRLPEGTNWRQLVGIAAIGGVGFTVSLFIAGLSFVQKTAIDDARFGILAASVVAALGGIAILRGAAEPELEGGEDA